MKLVRCAAPGVAAALLVSGSMAGADYSSSVDEDGCWDAVSPTSGSCIEVARQKEQGGRLYVYYANTCDHPIHAKVCHELKTGKQDCGYLGIAAGEEAEYWSRAETSTGNFSYAAVGLTDPAKAWVCMSRYKLGQSVP